MSFIYWECKDCGFDAVTKVDHATKLAPICPICAWRGDRRRRGAFGQKISGSGNMRMRPIEEAPDKVEGYDARKI